ncbi:hypothetical protein Poly21_32090 [Allorhodopirellula heiligendammensis]|uniref:Glycosyltransferase RgtA/B/C/D-like domain-containing protein n=1 Tax=Allorhodopirellula heiligendammensis TaxID=2714739 RepID=A0A5C6BYP7_9BACT|nr:hypothetical protein Poly21_32090 [Allorhodopirellula heiligendammensis]
MSTSGILNRWVAQTWPVALMVVLLSLQSACLGWHAYRSSPVHDEFGHFFAGLAYWKYGDVQLFNVNPPLIRGLGTFPASRSSLLNDLDRTDWEPPDRPEFLAGRRLFLQHPNDFQSTLFQGRLLVSVFALVGTVVCYLWGRDLSNRIGGLCAAILWAFQPQVLSHGSLITNDVPVAVMMVASAYLFTKWIQSRTIIHAAGLAVAFGIALICKFTALLLVPLFAMWILITTRTNQWKATLYQSSVCLAICWLIVCLPYRFAGVLQPLGEHGFFSDTLSPEGEPVPSLTGNRFRGTLLANLPTLVPAQYLLGLDRQQYDFDRGLSSYAWGSNHSRSWWWFYLYSMMVKLPVGTWLAIGVGLVATVRRFQHFDQSIALATTSAMLILFVISVKSGIGQQVRYVIPAYPFLFVSVANAFSDRETISRRTHAISNLMRGLAIFGCLLSVSASVRVAPDWMPFFNQAVGGSSQGFRYLYNDATDWEQSRYDMEDWLHQHPGDRPAFLVTDTLARDEWARSDTTASVQMTSVLPAIPDGDCWLIVSQTSLSLRSDEKWLWHQTPVDSIHGAYLVYKVSGQQCRENLNAILEIRRVPEEDSPQ